MVELLALLVMLTKRMSKLISVMLIGVLVAGYVTVVTPVSEVTAAIAVSQLPTVTPSPLPPTATLTSTTVIPQPGASFSGDMKSSDTEIEGTISFQVSPDSASISNLELVMLGDRKALECSNDMSVEISEKLALTFEEPFALKDGGIEVSLSEAGKLTGQFISPTAATGAVDMALNLPVFQDSVTCNFGSWNWTAQADTSTLTQTATLTNTSTPTPTATSEAAAISPPSLPSTPPPVRAAGWEEAVVPTLCLEIEQVYPDLEGKSPEPITDTVQHLLTQSGLAAAAKGAACQATLSFALTGQALGDSYVTTGYCYSGAEFSGSVTLAAPDYPAVTLPISGTQYPPFSISTCPIEPADAPFASAWSQAVIGGLVDLWGWPVLVPSLLDEDVLVSNAATKVLAGRGPEVKEVIPALVQALADENSSVRRAAANALGQFGSEAKEAIPSLIQALEDKESSVRQAVVEALGQIGPEEGVIPVLTQALEDEDSSVRMAAAKALGQFGPEAKEAIPALIQALGDEDNWVREAAAEALGQFGPEAKEAIPALTQALADEDRWVRAAAVNALREIGPGAREAVPALIQALNDEDDLVPLYASSALRSITGQDFGDDAARWQQWWEEQK